MTMAQTNDRDGTGGGLAAVARTGAALALSLAAVLAAAGPGNAGAFVVWRVAGVPWGDVLNVRAYPASTSRIQAAYPNGTRLSMTGRCTDGLNLKDIQRRPAAWQRAAVRYRWCEVWHAPRGDGRFVTGWVYGRYLSPDR